jgi:hypothetical protein
MGRLPRRKKITLISLCLYCFLLIIPHARAEDDEPEPLPPTPTKKEGDSCDSDNDCVGNLMCVNGKCSSTIP